MHQYFFKTLANHLSHLERQFPSDINKHRKRLNQWSNAKGLVHLTNLCVRGCVADCEYSQIKWETDGVNTCVGQTVWN